MSVNYIDKSTGDLIRVAGQGKAEYGASTERKGDVVIPATTAGNFQSVNVVFAQAMPDNDYAVVIDEGGNTWAHGTTNVTNKTTTGFTLYFLNVAGSDAPQMTFKYRAFKLYTDTEYNNLLNNAVLISDVTDAVTNGDMNPVTSNAVYDAITELFANDVPPTYYVPTPTTGSYIASDCWYMRKGNVVTVNMGIASFESSSDIVFTLPAKLRPTKGRVFTQAGGNTESCCGSGNIETNGNILISNNNTKTGFFATWTYCVD